MTLLKFLTRTQRTAHLISRAAGDAAAARRGTLPQRLIRRQLTRALFRRW